MTRLLISVRNLAEARIALAARVGLIDVKEPNRGSLGSADGAVIEQIVQLVDGQVPTSAALGELAEAETRIDGLRGAGLSFAKIGLANCGDDTTWRNRWRAAMDRLDRSIGRIAVVYADWLIARSPAPEKIIRTAADFGCRGVLFDTFDKSAGALVDHLSSGQLARYVEAIRAHGMLVVLAGSLRAETIAELAFLRPDYFAVRGAACKGDRTNKIDGSKLRELVALVEALVESGPADAAQSVVSPPLQIVVPGDR